MAYLTLKTILFTDYAQTLTVDQNVYVKASTPYNDESVAVILLAADLHALITALENEPEVDYADVLDSLQDVEAVDGEFVDAIFEN